MLQLRSSEDLPKFETSTEVVPQETTFTNPEIVLEPVEVSDFLQMLFGSQYGSQVIDTSKLRSADDLPKIEDKQPVSEPEPLVEAEPMRQVEATEFLGMLFGAQYGTKAIDTSNLRSVDHLPAVVSEPVDVRPPTPELAESHPVDVNSFLIGLFGQRYGSKTIDTEKLRSKDQLPTVTQLDTSVNTSSDNKSPVVSVSEPLNAISENEICKKLFGQNFGTGVQDRSNLRSLPIDLLFSVQDETVEAIKIVEETPVETRSFSPVDSNTLLTQIFGSLYGTGNIDKSKLSEVRNVVTNTPEDKKSEVKEEVDVEYVGDVDNFLVQLFGSKYGSKTLSTANLRAVDCQPSATKPSSEPLVKEVTPSVKKPDFLTSFFTKSQHQPAEDDLLANETSNLIRTAEKSFASFTPASDKQTESEQDDKEESIVSVQNEDLSEQPESSQTQVIETPLECNTEQDSQHIYAEEVKNQTEFFDRQDEVEKENEEETQSDTAQQLLEDTTELKLQVDGVEVTLESKEYSQENIVVYNNEVESEAENEDENQSSQNQQLREIQNEAQSPADNEEINIESTEQPEENIVVYKEESEETSSSLFENLENRFQTNSQPEVTPDSRINEDDACEAISTEDANQKVSEKLSKDTSENFTAASKEETEEETENGVLFDNETKSTEASSFEMANLSKSEVSSFENISYDEPEPVPITIIDAEIVRDVPISVDSEPNTRDTDDQETLQCMSNDSVDYKEDSYHPTPFSEPTKSPEAAEPVAMESHFTEPVDVKVGDTVNAHLHLDVSQLIGNTHRN